MAANPAESAEDASAIPEALQARLPRWLREIPLYESYGATGLLNQGSLQASRWARLPFITKEDIRRNFPHNFLRPGLELDSLLEDEVVELEHTAGTSEARTPLLLPLGWWSKQEERALRLNPLVAAVLDEFPEARRVTINSPMCSSEIRYNGTLTRADRVVGRTLFASLSRFPFLWDEAELARLARETVEWQPQFLDLDPVYGVKFALYCEKHGVRLNSLRFVLCSYEFVSRVHRRILERVFRVPVLNLYGSTETGHLLMEVGRGDMRPSAETAFFEFLPAEPPGLWELLVTTLENDFMPLLRYRIGDLIERRPTAWGASYCVHGRVADTLARGDGSRVTVWQVDQCFGDFEGIAHYQLRAQKAGRFTLRYVPDTTRASGAQLEVLRSRLGSLLGSQDISLEETDMLLAETSGKFRLTFQEPGL